MTEYTPQAPFPAPQPGRPSPSLDDARERAIRLLTDGYAYDVISEEEFEWRLGRLSHADNPNAVDALVSDLAVPIITSPSAQVRPAALAPAEGRILSVMSDSRREGPWRLPQRLRIVAVMSSVRVDLRYAVIPPACTIEVAAVMANVSFIVAPGMPVEFDVSPFMGATRNDATIAGPAGYRVPQVTVRGTAFMSEVRVRLRALGR